MKKLLIILLLINSRAYAQFSANVDAGRLRLNANSPMPFVGTNAATNPPYQDGSLLLLVAAGANGTFSNALTPGQYVSTDDIFLAAGGFNIQGGGAGSEETFTSFTISSAAGQGQLLALRWFPQITYAQFLAGNTPAATQAFGTYNPRLLGNASDAPDGGNNWIVPGSGSINLNFITTNSAPPAGTQAPFEGYANFTVNPIPEPSTYALLGLGLGGLTFGAMRRRQLMAV